MSLSAAQRAYFRPQSLRSR